MIPDLLNQLSAAANERERHDLITRLLLSSLPADLSSIVLAASVPHWFDVSILRRLEPRSTAVDRLYFDLIKLPLVESYIGRGYNVHEMTRRVILEFMWAEKRRKYKRLSLRLFHAFSHNADPALKVEQIYHLLIAHPKAGADAVHEAGELWLDDSDYVMASSLSRAVREHAEGGRVRGRAIGWSFHIDGRVAINQREYAAAATAFRQGLANAAGDKTLGAKCLEGLRQVEAHQSSARGE